MGPIVAQSLAAVIANLIVFSAGMIFGWPSPSLPKLLKPTDNATLDAAEANDLKVTSDEGSWIVGISSFGAIFGPVLSNLLVDHIGRKWSLMILAIPTLTSWLIIGLATSVEALYVGRFISGLPLGAIFAVMPMYLGEIAEDKMRGALNTGMCMILFCGVLLSFCIGPWLSRQMLSVASAIPPLIFLLLFPWMPETPYFLLMKGDRKKAMASLVWLRRRTDVDEELTNLETNVIAEQKHRNSFGIAKLFSSAGSRRAFIIAAGLLTFQQLTGAMAIQSYASLIFESAGLTGWADMSVIIVGSVQLLFGIASVFVIDVAGRRPILMTCATLIALFLTSLAVFFHFKYLGYDTSSFTWTPLLGIIGFYIAFMPGLSSIPYIMIAELFPTNVKAPATMLLAMYGASLGIVIAKFYQIVSELIGIHWVFYTFAMVALVCVIFVYYFVPETKRASLEEIQTLLNSGRSVVNKTAFVH